MLRLVSLYAITLGLISSPIHKASALEVLDRNITIEEVKNTQNGWCDKLVRHITIKDLKKQKIFPQKLLILHMVMILVLLHLIPLGLIRKKTFAPQREEHYLISLVEIQSLNKIQVLQLDPQEMSEVNG